MKKWITLISVVLLITACTRATNQVYLQAAQVALSNYHVAVDALDVRIEMYENDQQLINDAAWKAESLQILDNLLIAGNGFKALPEATTDLSELNRLLQAVAEETALYVESMTTAINNLDVNGIDSARAHRETIGQYLDDAQVELNQFLPAP